MLLRGASYSFDPLPEDRKNPTALLHFVIDNSSLYTLGEIVQRDREKI